MTTAQIGHGSIWREELSQLLERWLDIPRNADRAGGIATRELEIRLRQRTGTILSTLRVTPAKSIQTPQQWNLQWDAPARTRVLVNEIERLGWKIALPSQHKILPSDLPFIHTEDDRLILLDRQAAALTADQLKAAGLLLPFTAEDAIPLLVSEELYGVAAQKLGNTPPEYIEELGRHLVTQSLLGLPFNPIITEVFRRQST